MYKPRNVDETNRPTEIWGSRVSEYEDYYIVGCEALYLYTRSHTITF